MDDCPTCFATRAVLQHEAGPCGVFWTYEDPLLSCYMSFTEDMDTTVSPPASLIKIDVDDVQKTAISFDWLTDRMFRATYAEATLGPVDVDLKTLSTHPNFRTALLELVFPFDEQCYELDLSATAAYADPDLTIVITFQSAMDQTVTPLTSEMNIYANDVLKAPDGIAWQTATKLNLIYSEAALPPDYDVELPAATDRLRSLIQTVIPPFRLDTLGPP